MDTLHLHLRRPIDPVRLGVRDPAASQRFHAFES